MTIEYLEKILKSAKTHGLERLSFSFNTEKPTIPFLIKGNGGDPDITKFKAYLCPVCLKDEEE